jgi:arabinose-5-phosphate isomerase
MSQPAVKPEHRFDALIAAARRALKIERKALDRLIVELDGELGNALARAIDLIRAARGRTILSGIGKSGHIARKIAATLASTGTPAYFVHPAEASHGDLGMITADDVLLVLSNSGESPELKDLLNYSRRFAIPLIAMTARKAGSLAQAADVVLCMPQAEEACSIGLAPTSSTTMQLALGDAIAMSLLEDRGFDARRFKDFHPGGKLGAALKHVREIMHHGAAMPLCDERTPMSHALLIMTEKSLGCLGVLDADGRLNGIITDGDLRRHMSSDLLELTAGNIMTTTPKTMAPEELAADALNLMNTLKITSVFVVEDGRPTGVVHIHDLLRLGIA